MRALGMEPKAQCKERRRACTYYTAKLLDQQLDYFGKRETKCEVLIFVQVNTTDTV